MKGTLVSSWLTPIYKWLMPSAFICGIAVLMATALSRIGSLESGLGLVVVFNWVAVISGDCISLVAL